MKLERWWMKHMKMIRLETQNDMVGNDTHEWVKWGKMNVEIHTSVKMTRWQGDKWETDKWQVEMENEKWKMKIRNEK